MKVDLVKLVECIQKLEENYPTDRGPKLNQGPQFDAGFLYAMAYLRKYVIPAIEEICAESNSNALYDLQLELDALRKTVIDLQHDYEQLLEDLEEDDDEDYDD